MSGGSGGRVSCTRCGANNFDTVTACWKCGESLGAGHSAAPGYAGAPSQGASAADAGTPGRAALWLGLLFPYFGLPIGLAFMMCDDRRRQEVGRICILWSGISMVAHVLVGIALTLGLREYVGFAINTLKGAAGRTENIAPGLNFLLSFLY